MNSSNKEKALTIVKEIENHIKKNGGIYLEWYVGITDNINERLFEYHNVEDCYIHRKAPTVNWARAIEKHFIEKHLTDGGSGGGNDNSSYVYAYKIGENTKEREEDEA
jgi:hypothetical protein